jgi:hypothetical protein
MPSKMRFSFDVADAKGWKFVGEHTVNGKWIVDENSTMKPAGGK